MTNHMKIIFLASFPLWLIAFYPSRLCLSVAKVLIPKEDLAQIWKESIP